MDSPPAPFFSLLLLLATLLISAATSQPPPPTASASAACKSSPYPKLCRSILAPAFGSSNPPSDSYSLTKFSVKQCTKQATRLSKLLRNFLATPRASRLQVGALEDCLELADTNVDFLDSVSSALLAAEDDEEVVIQEVTTLLSATVTNQQTCADGLVQSGVVGGPGLSLPMVNATQLYSVALGLVTRAMDRNNSKKNKKKKRIGGGGFGGGPAGWRGLREPLPNLIKDLRKSPSCRKPGGCGRVERNLDEESSGGGSGVMVRDYVIVSPSGEDNFTTITEAIAAAPNNTKPEDGYFVIYAKEGIYEEYIVVAKNKKNIMLIGDGINRTVITGNHSVVDGWTTFNSSSFAVSGERFTAVDVTFRNTAGPEKHQAVAVRNSADLSTFYRCSFEGYQDTLYAHSLRQFYRDCDVYGTVDFIFGNAAAVFQGCRLLARKPLPNQKNAFTAQGRTDPNQNTGISIHNCTIEAAPDLAGDVNSTTLNYLGRPWKQYSRTVVMESYIGGLIEPVGWLEWNGSVGLDTLYYGEFRNYGPGSDTGRRVKWSGYQLMDVTEAVNFTVYNLTTGDTWLPYADVPFNAGLIQS
ncbi:unnamed protein product [Linum trigynum]|uniref:Pectinesterase n=1 Tax=Linum trigynum TaxID=586398 RepID=A0AAV2EMZ9_9ROSI